MATKTQQNSIENKLEPDAREELADWSLQNLVENTLEDPGYGMEEEAQVLLPDLSTIDRRHQEAIYEELEQMEEVSKEDGELVFDIGVEHHGVKPAVVWDMGSNEYESTIPPMEDPRRVEQVANTLVEKTREAAEKAVENGRIDEVPDIYRLGQNPGMSDPELAEEIGEELSKSNVQGEDQEFDQDTLEEKSKEADRYFAHSEYLVNDEGEPGLGGILGTASHQVTGLPQFETYIQGDVAGRDFESVEEEFEMLRQHNEESDEFVPQDLEGEVAEAYDKVAGRLETAFGDLHGSGPFTALNKLSPFFTILPKANSPGFVENEEGETERTYSDRMHNYRHFEDLKPVDVPKALSHPEEDQVEDLEDWVDLKANLNGEFGPEREAGELEVVGKDSTLDEEYEGMDEDTRVVTSFSPEDGERKSFAQAYNNGEFTGIAVFEVDGEKQAEKVTVDGFGEQEDIEEIFDLQVSGSWPSIRYRPSVGAFELRDMPTTDEVAENFTLGTAALKKSHDIQNFFKELGYDEMSWEEGMMHRMGIADELEDYEVEVEDVYGDQTTVTAGEIFYGSKEVEFNTEYDSLLDILAEGAAELAGQRYGEEWSDSIESQEVPADRYHDENGIDRSSVEPADTSNTISRTRPKAD